ncbi:MAG TPA: transposase family protein, partial [Micromonosporaceae bacterium]
SHSESLCNEFAWHRRVCLMEVPSLEIVNFATAPIPRRARPLYRLPGLSLRAGEYVVGLVRDEFPEWDCGRGRPRAVSAVGALRLALCHVRRNCTYGELAEDNDVAVSTAWCYVRLMTVFLAEVLGRSAEDLRDGVAGKICLVDGSLVPVFNWRHRRDLYSGRHRRHGVNIQAVVDVHGRLIGVSRAFPGSRHDRWCFEQAGFGGILAHSGGGVGDSGYQGCGLVSPIKKKPGVDRSEHDIEFNTGVAKIRVGVEWGFSHLKNWRILASRYRGDLSRIDSVIQAVTGLQILNEQFSDRRLIFRKGLANRVFE